MPTYKHITADTTELLYQAVKNDIDFKTGVDTPIEEIQTMVDEYLAGQIDVIALLDDIQNELDWIPGERDNLQNAIDNVIPGLAIPATAKAVLTGLAENQRRILQEQLRELRAWKWWIKNGKRE